MALGSWWEERTEESWQRERVTDDSLLYHTIPRTLESKTMIVKLSKCV